MPDSRVTTQQKKVVEERAKGCCEYCRSQSRFAVQPFSAEHIIPPSKGGKTALDNLALSWQGCNNHKYNKMEAVDPISEDVAKIFHPRKQEWGEHFAWGNDFSIIIGITPTGRATVATLQLNRDSLVNLRRILYSCSEHPPS